eukprot:GFKZ01007926.1.p1 GENE.GFKZ01007926.1~~GFKZ01007926.1.p1  ORF type:complete len:334 (-),score=43.08 GFKZ01007926.1:802-1803(-)
MSDVRTWFEKELQSLGFAGLEGVYDYLSTMSDSECVEYLRSLLGSNPEIQRFASAYVANRATGRPQPSLQTTPPKPTSNDSFTTWASSGAANTSSASKKTKKSRGKGRNGAPSKGQGSRKEDKPSFANAVTHQKASASSSKQMEAIRNSPVEIARQKIREYRQAKRPVNCIKCGKIQMIIKEDGACSFCGAALFAIWERKEERREEHMQDMEAMTKRKRPTVIEPIPVVLGRYTFPSTAEGKGSVRRVKDIQYNYLCENGEESEKHESSTKGGTGIYRNPNINEKDLEEICRSAEELLRQLITQGSVGDSGMSGSCGLVQIDDLSPSVYVQTD